MTCGTEKPLPSGRGSGTLLRKDILKPSEHYVERSSIYGAQPLHQTLLIKRADLVEQDQACLPLEAHMDPEWR